MRIAPFLSLIHLQALCTLPPSYFSVSPLPPFSLLTRFLSSCWLSLCPPPAVSLPQGTEDLSNSKNGVCPSSALKGQWLLLPVPARERHKTTQAVSTCPSSRQRACAPAHPGPCRLLPAPQLSEALSCFSVCSLLGFPPGKASLPAFGWLKNGPQNGQIHTPVTCEWYHSWRKISRYRGLCRCDSVKHFNLI